MAYLRPHVFVRRVFNPLAMRLGLGGTATLVVRRRQTRRPQRVPVIPVELGGTRYLVSTRGESDWVRNVRAAGGEVELESRGRAEPVLATELPVGERPPVIAAYRERAGRTVDTYFRRLPDPADHPIFRLEPRRSG
jgi:hypothetical protein